jgi:hypothetical protein
MTGSKSLKHLEKHPYRNALFQTSLLSAMISKSEYQILLNTSKGLIAELEQ